jgi:hypothetical protein
VPFFKVHGLRTGAATYLLAALLTLACAAFFAASGRRGALERPVPGVKPKIQAGYYSYRSRLLAAEFGLTGVKNKIEKRLESGFSPARSFGLKDADGLLRICADLEPLLLEMSGNAYPQPYLSQITAARSSARELVFEASKLKSLMKGSGPDSAGVLRQLSVVEKSIDRLQTHIEGLAR